MPSGRRVMPQAIRIAPPATGTTQPHPELRRQGIGGSDIAAIAGFGEFGKTALDVYLAKKGIGGERRSARLDEAARFGHLMESVIAREFAVRSGLRLLPSPGMLANVDRPWALANLDRLVTDAHPGRVSVNDKYVLEIKTRSAYQAGQWKDEAADGPALQLAWYLGVTGAQRGYIAALIGGNSLRWYEVQRDGDLVALLFEAAEEFRGRLANDDPPPPDGSPHTTELLNSVWAGDPSKILMLDDATYKRARYLRDEITRRAARASLEQVAADTAENELRLMMGEAEAMMHGIDVIATWRRNGTFRKKDFQEQQPELAAMYGRPLPGVDTRKLASDHPEAYAAYRSRVFRLGGGE